MIPVGGVPCSTILLAIRPRGAGEPWQPADLSQADQRCRRRRSWYRLRYGLRRPWLCDDPSGEVFRCGLYKPVRLLAGTTLDAAGLGRKIPKPLRRRAHIKRARAAAKAKAKGPQE
jgi:hypothetical protein